MISQRSNYNDRYTYILLYITYFEHSYTLFSKVKTKYENKTSKN